MTDCFMVIWLVSDHLNIIFRTHSTTVIIKFTTNEILLLIILNAKEIWFNWLWTWHGYCLWCLASMVQAAGGSGVMVWGVFSCHTLSPVLPSEHHLASLLLAMLIPLWPKWQHTVKPWNSLLSSNKVFFCNFIAPFASLWLNVIMAK